jgi:hypothetical protein
MQRNKRNCSACDENNKEIGNWKTCAYLVIVLKRNGFPNYQLISLVIITFFCYRLVMR